MEPLPQPPDACCSCASSSRPTTSSRRSRSTATLSACPSRRPTRRDGGARVVILDAGRATLEIANPAQKRMIDDVEVGRQVAPQIRLAFEVADAVAAWPTSSSRPAHPSSHLRSERRGTRSTRASMRRESSTSRSSRSRCADGRTCGRRDPAGRRRHRVAPAPRSGTSRRACESEHGLPAPDVAAPSGSAASPGRGFVARPSAVSSERFGTSPTSEAPAALLTPLTIDGGVERASSALNAVSG